MYRVLFLLLIASQALSFQAIAQKKSLPAWLSAEKKNDKLVYVNGVTIADDTNAEMPTRITVEIFGSEPKKATFDTFSDRGNFEFYLRPDKKLYARPLLPSICFFWGLILINVYYKNTRWRICVFSLALFFAIFGD